MCAVDQRAVELEDVGRDADQLLQARVAGAGVVERHPGAAAAQGGELGLQLARGAEQLVLGQLDHDPAQVVRERLADRRRQQRARGDVEREIGALRPARSGQRAGQRQRLQLGPEPDPVGLGEPLVRAAARLDVEAGERLVAAGAARGELDDRLEDDPDGVRSALQQRRRSRRAARSPAGSCRAEAAGLAAAGALGQYSAASPFSSSAVASVPSWGAAATPALASSGRPRTVSSPSAARARSAQSSAPSASTPGRISTNSSPPRRPTASPARTTERSRSATAARTRSPSAWPCTSLISLKWSRSMTTTPTGAPWAATERVA